MRSTCLVILILVLIAIVAGRFSKSVNADNSKVQKRFINGGIQTVIQLVLQLPNINQFVNLSVPLPNGTGICLKGSSGRGVGTFATTACNADEEEYGALCYPKCQDGYESVGCCICRQKGCPAGFTDDGVATCIKPDPYGRGAGYPWKFGDDLDKKNMYKRCEAEHGVGNCEEDGLIVYPKCKPGFHAVGCCVCSPDCPDGMNDIGVSCEKKSYGRGVGVSRLTCPTDQELDGLLCYDNCQSDWYGVGPVCWQSCPSSNTFDCGVMCTVDQLTCVDETLAIVKAAIEIGGDLFVGIATSDVISIIQAALKTATIIKDVMSNGYC